MQRLRFRKDLGIQVVGVKVRGSFYVLDLRRSHWFQDLQPLAAVDVDRMEIALAC